MEYILRRELEAGSSGEEQVAAFRQDLKAQSDNDNFIFWVNRFLFTARASW